MCTQPNRHVLYIRPLMVKPFGLVVYKAPRHMTLWELFGSFGSQHQFYRIAFLIFHWTCRKHFYVEKISLPRNASHLQLLLKEPKSLCLWPPITHGYGLVCILSSSWFLLSGSCHVPFISPDIHPSKTLFLRNRLDHPLKRQRLSPVSFWWTMVKELKMENGERGRTERWPEEHWVRKIGKVAVGVCVGDEDNDRGLRLKEN